MTSVSSYDLVFDSQLQDLGFPILCLVPSIFFHVGPLGSQITAIWFAVSQHSPSRSGLFYTGLGLHVTNLAGYEPQSYLPLKSWQHSIWL